MSNKVCRDHFIRNTVTWHFLPGGGALIPGTRPLVTASHIPTCHNVHSQFNSSPRRCSKLDCRASIFSLLLSKPRLYGCDPAMNLAMSPPSSIHQNLFWLTAHQKSHLRMSHSIPQNISSEYIGKCRSVWRWQLWFVVGNFKRGFSPVETFFGAPAETPVDNRALSSRAQFCEPSSRIEVDLVCEQPKLSLSWRTCCTFPIRQFLSVWVACSKAVRTQHRFQITMKIDRQPLLRWRLKYCEQPGNYSAKSTVSGIICWGNTQRAVTISSSECCRFRSSFCRWSPPALRHDKGNRAPWSRSRAHQHRSVSTMRSRQMHPKSNPQQQNFLTGLTSHNVESPVRDTLLTFSLTIPKLYQMLELSVWDE